MKAKIIIVCALLIVGSAILAAGSTFRWLSTSEGYQEYVTEETHVEPTEVKQNAVNPPLPGYEYDRADKYLVTYKKGPWPKVMSDKKFISTSYIGKQVSKDE